MIHLSIPDFALLIGYFAAVLWVGYRSARKTRKSQEDFLLAGRTLTLPVFIMTLVSSWYGGILGVGEFSYRYGISNWTVQGIPYYFFAAIFAMFLAKRVRATNLYTIPDKLESAYDKKTAFVGSILTFILMTPAPYIFMLAILLQLMLGWSLFACLVVTSIAAVSYLFVGGFRSDVAANMFEFVIMFLGFAIILPFCAMKFGGFGFIAANVPPLHLTWNGGNSIQFILVWFFIALWTLVDPAFHQRCYAAKDGATARRGILLSIIFWFLFDAMTATAGLYSRAVLPHLESPVMAYPMLAEVALPSVAKGIFYIGMIATIMGSLNTLSFVSAQTFGRDIVLRLRQALRGGSGDLDGATVTRYTQIGLVVTLVLSIALGLAMPSVIKMWYTIGTVAIPGLLVPLMASYFRRLKIPAWAAFCAMVLGWATSSMWLAAGYLGGRDADYPLGIEPMYPGLCISFFFWFLGKISTPRNR